MGYTAGENPSPKQLRKLLRVFSDGLRKNPDDLLLRLKLAEVLRLLERFDEAISLYSSVAWSYAVAGNLVQAIMLCKLILELKPSHRETQQMLAKLYASKRIREEKQSVPVRKVGDRWVVDPRDGSQVGPAPAASSKSALAPSLGPPPPGPDLDSIDDEAPLGEQAAEARRRAMMDTPPERPAGRTARGPSPVPTSPEAPRARREAPADAVSGPSPLPMANAPAPLPRLRTPSIRAPRAEPDITEPPTTNPSFLDAANNKAEADGPGRKARAKRATRPPPYRAGPLVRDRPTPEDAKAAAEDAAERAPVVLSEEDGRLAVGRAAPAGEDLEKWRPTMMQNSVDRDEPETSVELDDDQAPATRYGATNARKQHAGVHEIAGAPSHEQLPALPPLESAEAMPETFVGSVESVASDPRAEATAGPDERSAPPAEPEPAPITGPVSKEHQRAAREATPPAARGEPKDADERTRRGLRDDDSAARTGVQNISGRRRLRRETARMTRIRTTSSGEAVLTSARPTSDHSGPVAVPPQPESSHANAAAASSGDQRAAPSSPPFASDDADREVGGRPARPTLPESVHQVTPSQIEVAAEQVAPPSVDDVRLIEDLDDVEIIRAAIATPDRDLVEKRPIDPATRSSEHDRGDDAREVADETPSLPYDPRPRAAQDDRHVKPTKRYAQAQSRSQRGAAADPEPEEVSPARADDAERQLDELDAPEETELVARDEEPTDPDPQAPARAGDDSLGSDLAAADQRADPAEQVEEEPEPTDIDPIEVVGSYGSEGDPTDVAEAPARALVHGRASAGPTADNDERAAAVIAGEAAVAQAEAARAVAAMDGKAPAFDQTDVQSEEELQALERRALDGSGDNWAARVDKPTEVQPTVPPAVREALEADERPSRETAPMDSATASTLLRKDAELAFLEGPKVTECYAAISRQVRAEGQDLDDEDLSGEEQAKAERALSDTIRELSSRDSSAGADLPAGAPVLPLFSGLDSAAFVALVERLERRHFSPGAMVLSEGEEGDSLMLVAAGKLEVLKADETGQIKLADLEAGSFFGEFGLLTDQRRHASVRCLEECELLELRKEVLADLIREYPSIAQTLRRFYRERVLAMVMATSTIFQAVSPTERERVLARFTTRRFMGRETIVEEGGESSSFYVVLIGEVSVSKQEGDADVEVGRLKEGDYFGEMSLISGYPAEATVRALRMTEVLVLDTRDFYELASLHPEIWAEVQRASRVRQAINERLLASRKASAMLV